MYQQDIIYPITAIGGSGRSGTDLVAKCLGYHPEAFLFLEPKFTVTGLKNILQKKITKAEFKKNILNNIPNIVHSCRFNKKFPADEMSSMLFGPSHNPFGGVPEAKYAKVFTSKQIEEIFNSLPLYCNRSVFATKVVRRLYGLGLAASGTYYVIEKSPHNILFAGEMHLHIPETRFIHVIRDPRDVCCSILKQNWGPQTIDIAIDWYCDIMEKSFRSWRKVPDRSTYLVIQLEDIVAHPLEAVMTLWDHAGLPLNEEILPHIVKGISPGASHSKRYKKELSDYVARKVREKCADIYNTWKELAWRI